MGLAGFIHQPVVVAVEPVPHQGIGTGLKPNPALPVNGGPGLGVVVKHQGHRGGRLPFGIVPNGEAFGHFHCLCEPVPARYCCHAVLLSTAGQRPASGST